MLFLSHSHQVWKSLAQVWCGTWQYQNPRPGLHYFSAMSTSHSWGPFWSKMAAWSPDIMAACQTVGIRRGANLSSFQETSKKFHTLLLLPLCQPQLSHMATHNFTEDWQIESLFQKVQYPAKYQLQKRHVSDNKKYVPYAYSPPNSILVSWVDLLTWKRVEPHCLISSSQLCL